MTAQPTLLVPHHPPVWLPFTLSDMVAFHDMKPGWNRVGKQRKEPALPGGGERGDCPPLGHPYTSCPILSRTSPLPPADPWGLPSPVCGPKQWGARCDPSLPVRRPSPKPAPLRGPGRCIIHGGRADFLGAARCLFIEVELTGG